MVVAHPLGMTEILPVYPAVVVDATTNLCYPAWLAAR